MSDQDPQATSANQELAQQLYDMLMRDIEPDLLSYNIPKLDEYYADETEEEHQMRMIRYQKAYEEFDRVFQAFMNEVQDEVRSTKRSSLQEKESAAKEQEVDDVAELGEAIDSAAA